MKKIIILSALIIVLGGCSLNNTNLAPEQNKDTSEKADYLVLQKEENMGRTINFLAKNYQQKEVDPWFGAPMSIEQHGDFYLYLGDINDFDETNVVKLKDLMFNQTKTYFVTRRLLDNDFIVIEQYERNNDSRFYFWLLKDDSAQLVSFNGNDYVISGWGHNSIEFKDNTITTYHYMGDQMVDYGESYLDYLWDGQSFEFIMRNRVYQEKNNYSYFLDQDKENPTWQIDLTKDFSLNEYYITPNSKYIAYVLFEMNNIWQVVLVDVNKNSKKNIVSTELLEEYGSNEYPPAYWLVPGKSSDEFIYFRIQPVEVPGYYEYKYDIKTGENIFVEEVIKNLK